MTKLYLVLAALFGLAIWRIYKDYEGDRKKALLDVAMLLFLLGATSFGRYLLIYRPLFWIHLLLLLIGWVFYFLYLFGYRRRLYLIFSPILSIITFFILGFIFGD